MPPSSPPTVVVPDPAFVARAHVDSPAQLEALREAARADPSAFWLGQARQHLRWDKEPRRGLDATQAPHFRWFDDGLLNVSVNCLDRHLAQLGDRIAIYFEGERGDRHTLTYSELHAQVCRAASGLDALGCRPGDRVVIMMPHIPAAVISMLACARLGVVHSVVFGGFSADGLRDRIEDAGARVLITADGGWRNGKRIPLKPVADAALAQGCPSIERVVVFDRLGEGCAMQPGRDITWEAFLRPTSVEPVRVGSEHPLFLLYTSGSTGKPKGVVHASAGYLLQAITSMLWVFDLHPEDIYFCTADVGWITGHTYVAYGPLALGATQVMYEGGITTPHGGRLWEVCARYRVSILYTAPTAIRALMRLGDALPARHDLSSLRLLGSVGEPINPAAWEWYRTVIGGGRCPIVDTWWQTETGSIMLAPVPAVVSTKPGSCTLPLPGVEADIVDDDGEPVTTPGAGGHLVIRAPWPAMCRTLYNDAPRYREAYWEKLGGGQYVTGDGAQRDDDGYYWILGRVDDVLNVSGHRLSTAEIEAALTAHPQVAEAAVVGSLDPLKGEAVFAYVVLKDANGAAGADVALAQTLRTWVAARIGAIARPDTVRLCGALPKTRSGKVMRRLLRALARGEPLAQDMSTLENSDIIEQLKSQA